MSAAVTAHRIDAIDVEYEFARALADAGVAPHDGALICADGKLHRFRAEGDKPGRRNGWAVLYADSVPHGIAGNWWTGERITWTPDCARLTQNATLVAVDCLCETIGTAIH